VFATRYGRRMIGQDGGDDGVDNDFLERGDAGIGATIMGRNMFGPVRGPWQDENWTGWWGEEPPYHHPVFVLSHHDRSPVEMKGGTTFHFVTGGISSALEQAVNAAGGADVRLGGGPGTVRQYLRAGLLDELHLAVVPILLHDGERIFTGPADTAPHGYEVTQCVQSPSVTHVVIARG
jgi:dihydrofolate reductase